MDAEDYKKEIKESELMDDTGNLTSKGKSNIEEFFQEFIDKNYPLGAIEIYNRANKPARTHLTRHFKYGAYLHKLREDKIYSKFFDDYFRV